jgi:hypothetical protein
MPCIVAARAVGFVTVLAEGECKLAGLHRVALIR